MTTDKSQKELLIEMHTDIKWIKENICDDEIRLKNLEAWRYLTTGGIAVLTALVGWGALRIW